MKALLIAAISVLTIAGVAHAERYNNTTTTTKSNPNWTFTTTTSCSGNSSNCTDPVRTKTRN